ncbi:MAG TPA: M1 family metallopeptidase, partial [Myxococcota bacterium]|nr:M1 family metallopeptidase [Myxococcota bacterium]
KTHITLDPAKPDFSGEVRITVDMQGPRNSLLINSHELVITEALLEQGESYQKVTTRQADAESLLLRWPKKVEGEQTIRIKYTGKLEDQETQGLFRQKEGESWYLLSQFEDTDAREAFPCFDQPEFKTPWSMHITAPKGMAVFGNSPVQQREEQGDQQILHFAPTQPLPSYLVALAVGPFEVIDAGKAGKNQVPIRIAVPKGRGADASWAAQTTGPILEAMEKWTDYPYPYEKLDVVTIPLPVAFGAMENAGMITMSQSLTVVKPEDENLPFRRSYAEVMAHELAHQWFGDLVTPTWWTDIWLNESFASWFGTKIVDQLWPEWHMDVDRVSSRSGVMGEDVLKSARQVRQPVESYDDIREAFDGITYAKGQAVLEMVEHWTGPSFQAGVQSYLKNYAYKNADYQDFVSEITKAAGHPTEPIFRSFIEQPGLPLVDLKLSCEGSPRLELSTSRLLGEERNTEQSWAVPVCMRMEGAEDFCVVVDHPQQTIPLDHCPAWVIPNAGATGYYRVHQDFETLLRDAPLSRVERLNVLQDADALVAAGMVEPGPLLSLLPSLLARGEPELTAATVGMVAGLDDQLVPTDLRPRYASFIRKYYGPLAADISFVPKATDDSLTRDLRPGLMELVGDMGQDPTILADARRLADQWLTDRTGVQPEVVGVVLQLSASHGDAALLERLKEEALKEQDRRRRRRILDAMGNFRDPALVEQALGFALSKQLDLREAFGLVFGPLGDPIARQVLWDYTRAHIRQTKVVRRS